MAGTFRTRATLAVALTLSVVWLLAGAGSAQAATKVCPNTFHVLHDDYIGKLSLPEGHYRITLLKKNKPLDCAGASLLFRKFLEDFDGKLQGRWKVDPRTATFTRGGSGVGFSVERRGKRKGKGGGKHPAKGGRRCPNTFTVQHNDRIGDLRLPKGEYHYTRLTRTSPSCKRIPKLFAKFLQDFDGNLPKPWRVKVNSASFVKKGSGGDGFRVKPVR
jgi:hypothetical protein